MDDITTPRLLRKEQLAPMLGRTVRAIALAATARNENLVPLPIKIGRGLFWTVESVQDWITKKAASQGTAPTPAPKPTAPTEPKRKGTSTKAERRKKRLAAQAQAGA